MQERIKTVIQPADPEVWVRIPIHALGERTFLDSLNGADGERVVADYFKRVEAFEAVAPRPGPENLGPIFHYTDADLDSNRAGLISSSQRSRLWRRDMLQLVAAAASLVGGALFNVALLAGWFTAHGKGAVLGIALILVGVLFGVMSGALWLDLAGGRVAVAEGELRTTERGTRYGVAYSLEVGGLSFSVPRSAHDQVHGGHRRVYYLRRSGTLLALEPPDRSGA